MGLLLLPTYLPEVGRQLLISVGRSNSPIRCDESTVDSPHFPLLAGFLSYRRSNLSFALSCPELSDPNSLSCPEVYWRVNSACAGMIVVIIL